MGQRWENSCHKFQVAIAIAVFNRVPGICMTETNLNDLEKGQDIRFQLM